MNKDNKPNTENWEERFDKQFGVGHYPSGHEWSTTPDPNAVMSFVSREIARAKEETIVDYSNRVLDKIIVNGKTKGMYLIGRLDIEKMIREYKREGKIK